MGSEGLENGESESEWSQNELMNRVSTQISDQIAESEKKTAFEIGII